MKYKKSLKPIIHIKLDFESQVSAIIREMGLCCKIRNDPVRPEVREFLFNHLKDEDLLALIGNIPPEAFALRASIGGTPPGL